MANRNPDTTGRGDKGPTGNGHGYGEAEGVAPPGAEYDRTGERGRERGGEHEGRHYARAIGREREGRRDAILGMGFAGAGTGAGAVSGTQRRPERSAAEERGYRIEDHRRADRGQGGWTGGEEFEHGRAGFRDFGTPSYSQGRELRERYTDRDFYGRDDRVAGRSGTSFHPEQMETGRQWRPPEEEWERAHRFGGGRPEAERAGRRWQREPCVAEEIMTKNPRAVGPDGSLREVAEIMREENCGIVPVVTADRRLIGLITDRDMVMRTATQPRPWTEIAAREVMSEEIEAVTPDEPVREIIHLMGRRQVRRVPVVDRQDRLLGMIAMADVANRADLDDELQDALDQVSRRRSFWRRIWT